MDKKTRIRGNDDQAKQELFRFIRVVWRRWGALSLIIGTMITAIGCVLMISAFEPVYEAKLFFRIIHNLEWIELAKGLGDEQDSKSVLSMMQSEIISSRVATNEGIAKLEEIKSVTNPVKKLKSMVSVTSEGGRELFAISAQAKVPSSAALISQVYWDKFNLEQDHFKIRQAGKLNEKLEGEISSYNSQLKKLTAEMQDIYEKMTNSESAVVIGALGDVASALLPMYELKSQKNEAAIEAANRDIHRHSLNPFDTEYPKEDLAIELEVLPEVTAADKRLKTLMLSLEQNGWKHGPSHPNYKSLQGVVDNAVIELAKAKKDGLAKLISRKKRDGEKQNELEAEILQRQLEELEFAQKIIEQDIVEEQDKIQTYKNLRFEYERTQEKHAIKRSILLAMNQRVLEVRLKQIAPFSVTRVFISDAGESVPIPSEPVEKYPLKTLCMIAAMGMLLPFLLAALWEFQIKRVACSEQVDAQASLIGEIADLPAKYNGSKRRQQQTQVFQESVNGVSTYLRQAPNKEITSLAVTSAVSNEGKTTLACQLAVSLARTSSEPVLLIDCDLRSPSVHRVFDVELEPGADSVLNGNMDLADAIVQSHLENLDILPAGILRESPHKLLGQGKLAQVIRQAETKYSFIIIDTPPVLSASEALIATAEADATILCVMRDVSRIEVVNRAFNRLTTSMVNVIGYVFSGVPQNEYAQRYGGYDYAGKTRITNE